MDREPQWIWEHREWPNFYWDRSQVAALLASVHVQRGRLMGYLESLQGEEGQRPISQLELELLSSFAIEGVKLEELAVRSSLAKLVGVDLGYNKSTARSDAVAALIIDATQNHEALTESRIFQWHARIFSGDDDFVGRWRTDERGPMQVVSGPLGAERLHFEAPPAHMLKTEMASFFRFLASSDEDPVLLSGIAQLWFLMIHPFEDGNGRIARAISEFFLAKADGLPLRSYTTSRQLLIERSGYYRALELQGKSKPDITAWLVWYLQLLVRAISLALEDLESGVARARFWGKTLKHPLNERQIRVLERFTEVGFSGPLTTSKYAKLAKCSPDTALRDIQQLISWKLLAKNLEGGRSSSYRTF